MTSHALAQICGKSVLILLRRIPTGTWPALYTHQKHRRSLLLPSKLNSLRNVFTHILKRGPTWQDYMRSRIVFAETVNWLQVGTKVAREEMLEHTGRSFERRVPPPRFQATVISADFCRLGPCEIKDDYMSFYQFLVCKAFWKRPEHSHTLVAKQSTHSRHYLLIYFFF